MARGAAYSRAALAVGATRGRSSLPVSRLRGAVANRAAEQGVASAPRGSGPVGLHPTAPPSQMRSAASRGGGRAEEQGAVRAGRASSAWREWGRVERAEEGAQRQSTPATALRTPAKASGG